ncbi:MAG TPA: hypothetical protein VNF03_10795 [Patescibacteria group bacterium]|nr:hypothetical protein [Patescibacteria group bacterium]
MLRDAAQGLLAVPGNVDVIALWVRNSQRTASWTTGSSSTTSMDALITTLQRPGYDVFAYLDRKTKGEATLPPMPGIGNGRIGTQFCIGRSFLTVEKAPGLTNLI